jgi:23S rRNA (cytosine1962-C5)-methyltransferase
VKASSARLRLRVSSAAEKAIRSGHPWIFSDSVREQNRDGEAGELAIIYDREDKFLAVGFFDPESPIRFRVLHTGSPRTIDAEFWRERLEEAVRRREGLFDANTNAYRIINGESDGWPGLVLDRYGTTLVLKVYTGAWLPRLEEITGLIDKHLQPKRMIRRYSRNLATVDTMADAQTQMFDAKSKGEDSVVFLESGLKFQADVVLGQKTGFFLDQRENRRIVESLAQGRSVLNAFSFSGAFSAYAARGGARTVTDLDISSYALESARQNLSLNAGIPGLAACARETIQADAFEWLAESSERKFDLLVLDPPSLAKRETERSRAIRAYGRLVGEGIKHLSPNGILVACSCSAHVSAEEFFDAVRTTAMRSGRRFTELQTTRHAADHPATFPEAEYLKGIYLRIN